LHIFVMHSELRGHGSHVYTECLGWIRVCRDRGVGLSLFGGGHTHPDIIAETGAVPIFRETWQDMERFVSRADHEAGPDPYSEGLEQFMRTSWMIAGGCRAAWAAREETPQAVIFPWATAAVANGAAEWLADVPAEERPKVLFNVVRPETTWKLDERREKAGGEFTSYRFAARRLRSLAPPDGLAFTAVDPRLARLVSHVTQARCSTAPLHQTYPGPDVVERLRPAERAPGVAIGVLGPTREEKGRDRLAEVMAKVSAARPDARFFLQITGREAADAFSERLRALRGSTTVTIQLGALPAEDYYARLLACDLVLLPYLPERYAMMPSGVFGEAVALGAPVVAPAATWMSDRLDEGWGAGETFATDSADEIAAATVRALGRLPELRARAAATADAWRKAQSMEAYVDHAFAALGLPV
jgi:glycosyltransferase involved in cell wall biosynthesis